MCGNLNKKTSLPETEFASVVIGSESYMEDEAA